MVRSQRSPLLCVVLVVIIIVYSDLTKGQWDCFNRRSWSYLGNHNVSCVLTGSTLDCQYCETWSSIIGNWSNAEELLDGYDLENNSCRVAGNSSAPWCYIMNMNGVLQPGFCRIATCAAHAGCRNGSGQDYRDYGQYTESGFLCLNWENMTESTLYPESGLDENFCRNPDDRDRPWCYYQTSESSEIYQDFCHIDECITDALSQFLLIPNARFNSYDSRVIENPNISAEACALECLEEESFTCLSIKFRDVHTYNDHRCTLSDESIYTLDLARSLTDGSVFDDHHGLYIRIDKICDAFLPDFTKLPTTAECPFPVDILVDTGRISANFTASSYIDNYPPNQTDVESAVVWVPFNDANDEWWQVCYSERVIITGLVTRGNEQMMNGEGCWVNSFKVDYSLDEEYWWNLLDYRDNPVNPKEFLANAEATCNTTIFLPSPLRTKCLRILPATWQNGICLSVEVLGCLDNDCDEALGLSLNGIHDNQIEASSLNGEASHSPSSARVGYNRQVGYGWIPQQSSSDQWIQVKFDDEMSVQGVVTQGCLDVKAWVESYTISYNQEPYAHDNGSVVVFVGNVDMRSLVRNDIDPPIVTNLLRVHPVTWYDEICLRLEFIGCKNRVCNRRLGMESFVIPNEAIEASSFYYRTPGYNGRLHAEMSFLSVLSPDQPVPFWGARGQLAREEWLQVDLGELHTVTGIITQGAGLQSELDWITSYRLAYWSIKSTNVSEMWLFYKDIEGNEMILPGNSDQNTEVRSTLDRPVITRRVRIMPYSWYRRRIRMRAEIVGCPLLGIGRVCPSEKGLAFGGKCYGSVSSNSEGACSDIFAEDSERAAIKSSSIQVALADHRSELVFDIKSELTIGASKVGYGDWTWDDGTPVIFEEFLFDLPVNISSHFCAALDGRSDFYWKQYDCQSVILRGTLCEIDIDECLSSENECSHQCVNDEGSYHCTCPEGHRLDSSRRQCVDTCLTDFPNASSSTVLNQGSACYIIDSKHVTWSEATNHCSAIQSHLLNASDADFTKVLNEVNEDGIWVEDGDSAVDDLCSSAKWNGTEIVIDSTDCDDKKTFICERGYADLRCVGNWSDDVTSHVTSASVGHIQAFSYPPLYNQRSSCRFMIKGPDGMNVRLRIIRLFLRQSPSNSHCQDGLNITDVVDDESYFRRGPYCGELHDIEITSQSNVVFIELIMWSLTPGMPHELGFEASYDMVDCAVIDCNAVCGGTVSFHGPSGSVKTNSFPSIIPPFTNCEYTITVQSDRYISLYFTDFNIERGASSCVDRVSVRAPTGILKRGLCGNAPLPLIVSNSSTITVALETGLAGNSTGFNLFYNTTDLGGCGFGRDTCSGVEYCDLSAAIFVSVNYPFTYSPNSQCRWIITTPESSYVTIIFKHFDVVSDVGDVGCSHSDNLIVYDGADAADSMPPVLGRFCNSNPPPNQVRSSLNAVLIDFAADDSHQGNGFYAEYRATYTELDVDSTKGYAECTCPDGWELFGSQCYWFTFLNETIRWNDASKMCRDNDAFLVSIKTANEMSFIHYMLTSSWFTGNNANTYIGLTDSAEEGHFRWEDRGPLSYADWFLADSSDEVSQPNGHEQEDCTMIKLQNLQSSANWHDIACASREASQFICHRHAEGNATVPSRIGNLSRKECPSGSRLVGVTCISLFLAGDNRTPSLPCQRIQSPSTIPLQSLNYVLGLLWPFRSTSIGTKIDIQGTYDYKEQILNPRPDDVSTEPCHMLEYNGFDWQLIEGDCTLHHNGSICYLIASDLVNICGEDMFECMNGECIRRVHVCDGRAECEGGEDERNCGESVYEDSEFVHSCPVSSFQCDMGRCISASFYCDFIPHCQDSSDEVNCAYPQCKDDEFECSNGQCIEASKQCNIIPDCVDGSDEEFCQFCSDETFQCYDGTCIPGRSVCDGSLDCPGLNSEDEQSCESTDDNTLRCFNGEKFDARWRCVYDFDEYGLQLGCRDVTHLRDCGDLQCSGNMFKCPNSYCLPLRRRCDSVADCPGGEDEFECELYSCPGFLQCHGERYCVTDDQICDGVKDCTDGDDEMFCDIACPSGCSCDGLSFACDSFDAWTPQLAASFPIAARRIMISNVSEINRRKRSSDVRWNQTTIEDALYLDLSPFSLLLSLELTGNGIEVIIPDTFINQRNLKKLDLSRNNIWILYSDTFRGLNQLTDLDVSANPLTVLQPGAFNSLSNLPFLNLQNLHLEVLEFGTFNGLESIKSLDLENNNIQRVETGAFDGLNHTHTLNLVGNDITNFDMDVFSGLDGLRHLSSDLFLFCCIVSDLESCYPPEDQFSSCQDLMRSDVLRIFMWILGFSAFVGNIFVVIERGRDRRRFRVQSFLIFNLAVSDCLMGIYMLIIACADAHFRHVYVYHAERWKASGMCKLAGILANLSSEVSVFILTVISLDRFLCIAFPFSQKHFGRKSVRIAAATIWVVCLVYSVIPAIPFPYFGDRFYGRSGVCLALPLTNVKPPGWQYAVSAIFINFIAMVTIIGCYTVIYVIAKRSGSTIRNSKQMSSEFTLAVRTAVIVATDICCWLPIVILAFVSLSNYAIIPPSVYAWIAVFVLPINSSINPYLYTISTVDVKTRLESFRTRSSFFSPGSSSRGSGSTGTFVRGGNKNGLGNSLSGDRDSTRSIPMNTPQSDRFILADALSLIGSKKLHLTVDDVQCVRKELRCVLDMIHACAMTHGSIDAHHVIIEKKKVLGKWSGSLILTSTPEVNGATNGNFHADDDMDRLEMVMLELNNALGYDTAL
ncbi:uncharacterized protein LOC129269692 [Lytechinus pictus]|uniref:uncharacterized protein LOC129269692 n=1 Tax=Lytechinus pictus TaxID=7653 RepID=UPI0030BA1BA9